jgi:hypothetical protein
MSDRDVDISGLDKLGLLKALWENQRVAVFYANIPQAAPRWDENLAKEALASGHIDYFQGRNIKMNLSGNTLRVSKDYDNDAPIPGAQVVEGLRRQK